MAEQQKQEDDLRPEYDLENMPSLGRGKYAERYRQGTNVVLLGPDVYRAFPTSEAVNEALRGLLQNPQPRAAE